MILHIILKRRIGYYMTTLFVPSTVIVVVSWIGFFLPPNQTPARSSLAALMILALVTHYSSSREMLPKV